MADVFISYARADRERIETLAAALQAEGLSVWWDPHIPGGADFSQEIERELNSAKAVIAAWTPEACESKWVRDEAAHARDHGKLVPILLAAVEPPLGFRQIQSIDFANWNGDSSAPIFKTLLASLRCSASQAAQPNAVMAAPVAVRPSRLLNASVAAGALAIAAALAFVAFAFMSGNRQPKEQSADGAALNPVVAALGASERPEERAAYESFVAGDRKEALTLLERLAVDLERSGERKAAAEAYTRAAAVALLVDQARGLAARRRAFELAPQSFNAFQGLFFDTFLMKGPDEAAAIANEIIETASDRRMRAFAYAHLAVSAADAKQDVLGAEELIARARALGPGEGVFEGIALWAGAVVDWRRDRLADARAKIVKSEAFRADLAALEIPFPNDVTSVRVAFSAGDWEGAFKEAAAAIEMRRKAAVFLPSPMLFSACLAGLYVGKTKEATPLCEATGAYAPAESKPYFAELAAARGDFDGARTEIAASRAIGSENPLTEAQLLRLEAQIAARSGDLDAAQSLLWRHFDLIKGRLDEKSRRATALRLFGLWMIEATAPGRACAPLVEAVVLYAEVGGEAGAEASKALSRSAGCTS
jgi:hypothetical protein